MVKTGDNMDPFYEALGAGKGKHEAPQRKPHRNKYASGSQVQELDPWDQMIRSSDGTAAREEAEVKKQERKAETRIRGVEEFPDEEDIDPYDPSTFGFTEVGYIMGPHGLTGEMKVKSVSDFGDERLCYPGLRYLRPPDRCFPRDVALLEGRPTPGDVYIVRLHGVENREDAAKLRDHTFYVKQADRVAMDDGEFLVSELVGLSAYNSAGVEASDGDMSKGEYVGVVSGVVLASDLGGNAALVGQDMLELELLEKGEAGNPLVCLIPFVRELVPLVDITGGMIAMELPEGTLELAMEREEKVVIRALLAPGKE
ncbi:unnamed protein product [Chrysoparadoxa australica]